MTNFEGNRPTDSFMPDDEQAVATKPGSEHEHSEVSPKPLFMFLLSLTLVVLFMMGVVLLAFNFFEARIAATDPAPPPLAGQRQPYEGIKLEPTSDTEITQLRLKEQGELHNYAWIDQQAGIVRVPIEVAIEAAVKNGLPKWEAPESATSEEPAPGEAEGVPAENGPAGPEADEPAQPSPESVPESEEAS